MESTSEAEERARLGGEELASRGHREEFLPRVLLELGEAGAPAPEPTGPARLVYHVRSLEIIVGV